MSQRSILITTSVLPVFLYSIISIGLWALTKRISGSQQAANIAAVLIFAQSALPEPYMIERRPLYLLSTMMLVTILIAIFIYSDSARGYGYIIFLSVFTLASIRLQYGAVLLGSDLLFLTSFFFGRVHLKRLTSHDLICCNLFEPRLKH